MSKPAKPSRPTRRAHPPDGLVLAAIERAARHRGHDTPEVPVWVVLEHLAIPTRSAAARHVRARLEAMADAGVLARARRHGSPTWSLTRGGHTRLAHERRTRELPELPESPQHRRWRNAQTTATHEIERFRRLLGEELRTAADLLTARPAASSDQLFALADRVDRSCRKLASATYCASEWSEPDDSVADIDRFDDPGDRRLTPDELARRRARRVGRRNTTLWDEP